MSEDAQLVVGCILAALAFLLMAAIAWFRWDDTGRLP